MIRSVPVQFTAPVTVGIHNGVFRLAKAIVEVNRRDTVRIDTVGHLVFAVVIRHLDRVSGPDRLVAASKEVRARLAPFDAARAAIGCHSEGAILIHSVSVIDGLCGGARHALGGAIAEKGFHSLATVRIGRGAHGFARAVDRFDMAAPASNLASRSASTS